MSIKYNIVQRGEPGVAGGGTLKFYAVANSRKTIGMDELTDEIASLSTVNGADVQAVLFGLLETITKFMNKGHGIQLGDLGYLRVSFSCEGNDTEEEVTPASITSKRILFRPGKKLRNMLKTVEFTTD